MAIVGGLDLHRKQITFDVLDTDTGQVRRGRISPADRQLFRGWLTGLAGAQVEFAVEGCTGWRFIIEECQAAGAVAHLAEPADVAGLRRRRRHAKTDPVGRCASARAALRWAPSRVLDLTAAGAGDPSKGPPVQVKRPVRA